MNKSKLSLLLLIIPLIILSAFTIHTPDKIFFNNTFYGLSNDTIKTKGKQIFLSSCNVCHKDSTAGLAPGVTILSAMTPKSIVASLSDGKMKAQGATLSDYERRAVAEYLTNSTLKNTVLNDSAFSPFQLGNSINKVINHSGWGNDLKGTGFRTAQQAGISSGNVSGLKLKWVFAFPDATIVRSKPAVINDWIIAGGQYGELFAINQQTGKIGWRFDASAAIRGAVFIDQKGSSITAYFADYSSNVYAIDVRTGKLKWNKRAGFDAQSSVTGSVVVYQEKVIVPISSVEVAAAYRGDYPCCISSGGVVALDAINGKTIWQYRVVPKATQTGVKKNGTPSFGPSGAPVWSSPTIDEKRNLVYIGTGQNYSQPASKGSDAIQALDIKTGKLIWSYQATTGDMYNVACPYFDNCPDKNSPDIDFGMAPIIMKDQNGRDILVAGQKSGVVHALSPETGKPVWKTRVGKGGKLGGIHWGMATDGKTVFAANADNILALDTRDTTLKGSPGIYAINPSDGQVKWKFATPPCKDKKGCFPSNSAAPMVSNDIVFAGSTDGVIRAYATADGKLLWEFDTARVFETVNGIPGKGGSIDGPAPVVANGMLFVNSGYGMFGQAPGNVLLAFEAR
jgi:polyvinyl alcohol dehydrogenase (cytochrome)